MYKWTEFRLGKVQMLICAAHIVCWRSQAGAPMVNLFRDMPSNPILSVPNCSKGSHAKPEWRNWSVKGF